MSRPPLPVGGNHVRGRGRQVKRDPGVAITDNLRDRLGAQRFGEFLRDLANPRKRNGALADKWALTPQRISQIRKAIFDVEVRYRMRPIVAESLGLSPDQPHKP